MNQVSSSRTCVRQPGINGIPMFVDLRNATVDDFVRFVFDHPVADEESVESRWYFSEELDVEFEPRRLVCLMTQLFSRDASLYPRFSVEQIEQGLWLLFGPGSLFGFVDALWQPDVPWSEREACIASIYDLYVGLLECEEFKTIDYMIPDLLADSYGHGLRDPQSNPQDRFVQEALLRLFERLLGRPEWISQYAGLHGLGHLSHERGPDVIQAYLEANPDLCDSLRCYAAEAMTGNVQ